MFTNHETRLEAIKKTEARRDEYCDCCGYPFDSGDRCYDLNDGSGYLVCSKKCAAKIVDLDA